jgi:hypothetical protein
LRNVRRVIAFITVLVVRYYQCSRLCSPRIDSGQQRGKPISDKVPRVAGWSAAQTSEASSRDSGCAFVPPQVNAVFMRCGSSREKAGCPPRAAPAWRAELASDHAYLFAFERFSR